MKLMKINDMVELPNMILVTPVTGGDDELNMKSHYIQ